MSQSSLVSHIAQPCRVDIYSKETLEIRYFFGRPVNNYKIAISTGNWPEAVLMFGFW